MKRIILKLHFYDGNLSAVLNGNHFNKG